MIPALCPAVRAVFCELTMQTYNRNGLYFEYPDDWELTEDIGEEQISLTLNAPGTAFWMAVLMRDRPSSDDVVESALASLLDEYPESDVYPSEDEICMLPTVARDVDFVCLELLGRATLRACETDTFTLLVLTQASDVEGEEIHTQLARVSDSLVWADDGDDETPAFDPFQFHNLFGGGFETDGSEDLEDSAGESTGPADQPAERGDLPL